MADGWPIFDCSQSLQVQENQFHLQLKRLMAVEVPLKNSNLFLKQNIQTFCIGAGLVVFGADICNLMEDKFCVAAGFGGALLVALAEVKSPKSSSSSFTSTGSGVL